MKTTFLGKREIPKKIKTEVVKRVVRPTIAYSSETWALSRRQKSRINGNEVSKKNRRDKIRNDVFRQNLQIDPINENIIEGQLRWFGYE